MQSKYAEVELPENGDVLGPPGGSVHIVCGTEEILRLQPLLTRYSEYCGQSGAMQDLIYFLGKPGLMKRVPHLFLLSRRKGKPLEELSLDDIAGSLLLLEYRLLRVGTRAFATSDRSGRGTLLCAESERFMVALQLCDVLIRLGAKVLMFSFAVRDPRAAAVKLPGMCRLWENRHLGVQWTLRQRAFPSHLDLACTLDATLSTLGQKTRSNMRYYRRRAERELGCYPVQEATVSEEELFRFNDEAMFPVSRSTVAWRLETLKAMADPFLMGMKDAAGRWMSIVAGRRCGGTCEILWQLNRAGYPSQSLGTVMRSYLIEHEIARGSKRLQVEGGTNHTMYHSFAQEQIVDMVVIRSRYKYLVERKLQRFLLPDNLLAQAVKNPDAMWHHA